MKCVEKSSDLSESYAMGFGLGFRVMGVKAGESQWMRMVCDGCVMVTVGSSVTRLEAFNIAMPFF